MLWIVLNNYLHDLATGMLFASGFLLFYSRKIFPEGSGNSEALAFYHARLQRFLRRLTVGSLLVVLAAGVPRTIFFRRAELIPAEVKGLGPVLVVKHVLLAGAVSAGLILWWLGRKKGK